MMAMSARDNNHTRMDEIQKRYFSQTGDAAGLPKGTLGEICSELEAAIPAALDQIASLAGNLIPVALTDSIGRGHQVTSRDIGAGVAGPFRIRCGGWIEL